VNIKSGIFLKQRFKACLRQSTKLVRKNKNKDGEASFFKEEKTVCSGHFNCYWWRK